MIFVRGIKGSAKLNPAITLWGGLAVFVTAIAGWSVYEIASFQAEVKRCQERDGVWIGKPSFGRLPSTGQCILGKEQGARGSTQ